MAVLLLSHMNCDILSVGDQREMLKSEQEGAIVSVWGASENNRRARFYRLTRDGRKQLQAETRDWELTAAIIGRFFTAKAEDLG